MASDRAIRRRRVSIATALALYDVWRRLPPAQRRWLTQQARTHGGRLAKQAATTSWNRTRKR
ncbi:MAG TPA: hypothetical protein VMH47_01400 [Gaiellaceae bacterium]|nr:hypothetical protein [Gaiellaceae bacterium]